jgi:hypothetical protein
MLKLQNNFRNDFKNSFKWAKNIFAHVFVAHVSHIFVLGERRELPLLPQ